MFGLISGQGTLYTKPKVSLSATNTNNMGAQDFLCNRIRTTLQNERSQAMLSLFSDQAILVDFPNDIIEANHS